MANLGCTQPSISRGSGKHPPEMSPKAKKHLPELQPPLSLLIGIFPPLPTGRWLGGEGDPQKRPLNLDASMDHLHCHPAEVPAH